MILSSGCSVTNVVERCVEGVWSQLVLRKEKSLLLISGKENCVKNTSEGNSYVVKTD